MGTLRTSPGAILPRDMDQRQWSAYTAQIPAKYWKDGQTAYDVGTGFWIGDDDGTPKFSIGNASGNKVTWDGSTLTVKGAVTAVSGSFTGGVTIGTGGSLSSGQSAFDTGAGYWLEYNGGTPRLSIGDGSGNKVTWDGSTLTVKGEIDLEQPETAFQVNWISGWTGGGAPTGYFYYRKSGNLVFIRCDGACYGTSANGSFSFDGWPAEITPANMRHMIVSVYNNGTLQPATLSIDDTGNCGVVPYDGTSGFNNSGNKGFTPGSVFQYALD